MNILNQTKDKLTGFLSGNQVIKKIFPLAKDKEVSERLSNTNNDPFSDMFYHSLAPMLLVEPKESGNHTIIDANKAAELFYGYSRKKLLKLHIGDLNTASKEERQRLMAEALQKNANTFSFTHILANKELKDVQVFSSSILIDGKKLMFLIIHDTSEQKKALGEIKEQQEYSQTLFNQSPDSLFIIDAKGTIIDGNRNAELLIGEKKENLIGKNIFETNIISDNDKSNFQERIKKIVQGDSVEKLEYSINRIDGSQILVEGRTEFIKFKGANYLLGTIRDITARKQQELLLKESEAKFRYLADFTFEWEYWISPEGKYIYNSPSCEQTTGYPASAFEKNPNLLIEITQPDFKELVQKHFTLETKDHSSYKIEFQIIKPDSELVWIEHSCQSIFDTEGNYLGKRGVNRNITKEKNALQSLEDNTERFKNLSQLTFEGILIHKNGIVQDANLALEKLSGYKLEEVVGHEVTDFIKSQKQKSTIAENIDKDHATPYESIFIKKDGTLLPIEIEAKDYTIQGEKFRVAAIRDITEKKKALNTLLLLNKALDNSKEVVFTTDHEGIFNYINPEFTKLYGYTKEDVIGKETPRILKSDNTSKEKHTDFWSKLLKKESISTTYVNKTKSGNLIDIEASADPILDENESIIGFLAIQRDITAKTKQEVRQSVVSAITKAVLQDRKLEELLQIIQNEINKVMDAQNFYYALYDKETETISTPYFSDDHDDFSSFPAKGSLTGYLIEQKKSLLVNRELFRELKKSKTISGIGTDPMVWLGVPLTKNNEVIGAFVVQSYTDEKAYTKEDITILEIIASQISLALDRNHNEEDLRTALAKAQESDRLKFTFLATMSHELRTPLNAIIGFSDLVDESRQIDEIISFCQVIHKSGNHLLGIVNEIFDFTLMETGEIKLLYEQHNLKEILSDVHQIIEKEQISLHKEHLALSLNIPPKAKDLIIETDKQRLQQVLLNLLKNALKFTDSGSIKFGFNLIKDENKAVIQFYVEDTGIGIARDQEKIIFDVFRQADDSTTRKHDGVGLGLAISKKITQLFGGELWLKSKLGKGTTFFFNVPCPSLLEGQESAFEEFDLIPNYDHKNQTILIAEDDSTNYKLLEFMLQPFNVNVLWARNGKQALDIFNSNPNINLILVDIKMPKLNGIEVTKFIKKMDPNIPVIVHTAYSTTVDKELAFKAGCDDYITKPFQKPLLFKLIRKYLD